MISTQMLVFFIVALVVIATAAAVLLSRNAVYSVLFLVANFASVAALYMILGASFIALAQVTVYAGAIMVLFLFVVMLLGAERLPGTETLRGQRLMAGGVFAALLVEAGLIVVIQNLGNLNTIISPTGGFATPADIGMALFTQYSLPFELTSVLLVVAAVGAIVLTHRPTKVPALWGKKEQRSTLPSTIGTPASGQGAGEQSAVTTPVSLPADKGSHQG